MKEKVIGESDNMKEKMIGESERTSASLKAVASTFHSVNFCARFWLSQSTCSRSRSYLEKKSRWSHFCKAFLSSHLCKAVVCSVRKQLPSEEGQS